MQLGTQTASLTNHLLARATISQPDPTLGMGATLLGWTDRYAATITGIVVNGGKVKQIEVKRDIATRTDKNGLSESQEYRFERDTSAPPYFFRRNRQGRWEQIIFNTETQRWNKCDGYGLLIGRRDHYRDPTF